MMKQDHYQKAAISVEPLAICAHFPFCFGNVVKYLMRADYKGDKRGDLIKARDYLREHFKRPADLISVPEKIRNDRTLQLLLSATSNKYLRRLSQDQSLRSFKALALSLDADLILLDSDSSDDLSIKIRLERGHDDPEKL